MPGPSLQRLQPQGKWRKGLLILLLSLGCIFAAVAALARTEPVLAWVRRSITEVVQHELGLTARIGSVELDVKTISLLARDIQLDHPENGPLASARTLRVRPWIAGLYRFQFKLKSITLEGARVHLVVRDGIVVNLPELPKSKRRSQEIELPFRTFSLVDSSIAIDAKPYGSGEVRGIEATVDGSERNLIGIELSAASGHIDHSLGRELIESITFEGHVKPHSFWIEQFALRSPHLSIQADQTAVELPLGRHYQGTIDVNFDLAHLRNLPHGLALPALAGLVRFRGDVRDEHNRPIGNGNATLSNVTVDGYGFGERVDVDLTAETDKVTFKAVAHLIGNGGSVALNGEVGLGEGLPLSVNARVNDVSFARLVEQLDVTPNAIVDWTLAGVFSLKGTLDPLDLAGPLRMPTRDFKITRDAWHVRPQRHVLAVSSAHVVGGVAIRPDGIHLEHLHGELPHSRVSADVLIGFTNLLRVRGSSEHVDLTDCTPLLAFPLGGTGSFNVEVDGGYDDPQVHGQLQFNDFAFNTFAFGDVRSDFRLEKDGLAARFPLVTAEKNKSVYSADQMLMDFSDDRVQITGGFDAERIAMADFYHAFHFEEDERFVPYQADLRGHADMRFTLGFPGDTEAGTLESSFDLDVLSADLNGFAFSGGEFAGHWKWIDWRRGAEGGELRVDHLSLSKGRGTVNVSGRMLQNGVLDMVVVADRIEFTDTEGFRDRMIGVSGTYGTSGTLTGSVDVPRMDLDVVLSNMTYQGRALGDGRVYVRHTDRSDPWIAAAARWSKDAIPDEPCAHARYGLARGSWAADPPLKTIAGLRPALLQPMAWVSCGTALNGQLSFDMAFGRTKVFPLRGRVQLHDLALDGLLPQGADDVAMTGAVSGTMDISDGAMLEPLTLAGSLSMPRFEIARGAVYLRGAAPIDVTFGKGAFRVVRAELAGPASSLRVGGGGSLTDGLALQVDGGVNLALLASLSTTVSRAQGDLKLRARIAGRLERPSVFGQATLRDGALRFASFPTPVEAVEGDITFSAQRVIVERFSARVAGGTLAVSGTAALSGRGLGNYLLNVEARDLQLHPSDGIQTVLGARTELAWEQGQRLPVLRGTIDVRRMRYTRPIQLGSSLTDIYRNARTEVEQYDPEADRVALDLRVIHDQPLKVENNLMDADVEIVDTERPFRIVGTDQRFGVLGTMRLRRGIVRFRDVAFDIREGEIAFDDPNRVFPRFDISAVTDIRRAGSLQQNWRISLRATGTSESFAVRTRSDPYLSEEDIALLLAIGMTNAELSQLQSGGLTGADALNALAAVSGVDDEVRRAVPAIDDFRVANGYSRRSSRNEPQLFVGKRIAEGVRLSATTGLTESRDLSTSVQWQLSEEASVEATYSNQNATGVSQVGDVGADLRWRLEFE